MHYRRAVALLLIALLGLALCGPGRPDDGSGAVRHGRHVGRPAAEGLTVRAERGTRHGAAGHRRAGAKVWSAGSHEARLLTPAPSGLTQVRSVDTLPSHWGARHLTI